MELSACQRIAIVGCPGSGKSALTRQIAAQTDCPVIHLDYEYWLPGWAHVPKEAFRRMLEE